MDRLAATEHPPDDGIVTGLADSVPMAASGPTESRALAVQVETPTALKTTGDAISPATAGPSVVPLSVTATAPRNRAQTQDAVIGAGSKRVASPFVVATSGSPVFQVLDDEDDDERPTNRNGRSASSQGNGNGDACKRYHSVRSGFDQYLDPTEYAPAWDNRHGLHTAAAKKGDLSAAVTIGAPTAPASATTTSVSASGHGLFSGAPHFPLFPTDPANLYKTGLSASSHLTDQLSAPPGLVAGCQFLSSTATSTLGHPSDSAASQTEGGTLSPLPVPGLQRQPPGTAPSSNQSFLVPPATGPAYTSFPYGSSLRFPQPSLLAAPGLDTRQHYPAGAIQHQSQRQQQLAAPGKYIFSRADGDESVARSDAVTSLSAVGLPRWHASVAAVADAAGDLDPTRTPKTVMPPSVTIQPPQPAMNAAGMSASTFSHSAQGILVNSPPNDDSLIDGDMIAVRIVGNQIQYQLDPEDVRETFSAFAPVYSVAIDPNDACIAYVKVAAGTGADIARILDRQPLDGMQGSLSCVLCPSALDDQPATIGVHPNASNLLDLPLSTKELIDIFLGSHGAPATRCSTHAVLGPSRVSSIPGLTAEEDYGLAHRGANMGASTTPCGPSNTQGFYQQASAEIGDDGGYVSAPNTEMLGSTPTDYLNMLLSPLLQQAASAQLPSGSTAPPNRGAYSPTAPGSGTGATARSQGLNNNSLCRGTAASFGGFAMTAANAGGAAGSFGLSLNRGTDSLSSPWQRAHDDAGYYRTTNPHQTPSRLLTTSPDVHSARTPEPSLTGALRFGSHSARGLPGDNHPQPSDISEDHDGPVAGGGAGVTAGGPGSQMSRVRKWTARFDIQIEPDSAFQVTRKIIGTRGANMKKINQLTGAKLRLRGQGSGYLEGSSRQEAEDPLHLCISCTDAQKYKLARSMTEKLLRQIYSEYAQWIADQGGVPPRLKIRYRELLLPSRGRSDQGGPSGNDAGDWVCKGGVLGSARSGQRISTPPMQNPGDGGLATTTSGPGGGMSTATTTGQAEDSSRVGTANDDGAASRGIAPGGQRS